MVDALHKQRLGKRNSVLNMQLNGESGVLLLKLRNASWQAVARGPPALRLTKIEVVNGQSAVVNTVVNCVPGYVPY